MATKKVPKRTPHALFWSLIRNVSGYQDKYKDVIKEGLVSHYSGGQTCSLSEMYQRYPDRYSLMIEAMKGDSVERQSRYEKKRDKAAKRVIAAICSWIDKLGYKFDSPTDKVRYAMTIACRAANCRNFNKIPESRLTAIYSLYCKKNSIDINGDPILDYIISKN